MKKTLLAIVAAFMVASAASAQKLMTIALNNGETITVKTSKVKDITFQEIPPFYVGTWKVKEIIETKHIWCDYITNWEGYPEFYPDDTFEFTKDGKLKTNLGSTLANYFYEGSNYVEDKTLSGLDLGSVVSGETYHPTVLSLDNVNRNFSDKDESEDKQAFIGVELVNEDESTMNLFIIDYTSTSFATEFSDYGMYSSTKPVATMGGVYVQVTLERVK